MPGAGTKNDSWVSALRGPRHRVDARRPYGFLAERERADSGEVVAVATVFLTNRECPWRCVMCDLWKNTLPESVPPGAIPEQIDFALTELASKTPGTTPGARDATAISSNRFFTPRQIKLYNSGSFFDPRAIPPEDHAAIAVRVRDFERVIVECHPALVGERVVRFRDQLAGQLEVAMGLETAHPAVLEKLNKRMSLDQFARAAAFLRQHHVAVRAFVLVQPPFLDCNAALEWAQRSVDFAFGCGVGVVSLVPTRPGNGALEVLAARGEFTPPRLATLEAATEYGVALDRGRTFADTWDLEQFADCRQCFPARRQRLEAMNFHQRIPAPIECPHAPPVS